MFEGLAAGDAAVQRLAGGGAEGRQALGLVAAAARAGRGEGVVDAAAEEADGLGLLGLQVRGAGRRDAVFLELALALGADPVGGPGRRAAQADAGRAELRGLEYGVRRALADAPVTASQQLVAAN